MPVTIKQHLLKVKDGSTYVGIDALAETTTAEHVTAINDAGAAQIAAVAAQGEASRASIPQEYTALSDSVNDLKSDVSLVADSNGEFLQSNIGIREYPLINVGCIATNATTMNINAIYHDVRYRCVVIPCAPGDVFHVDINSANTNYRPWAFVAADGTRKAVATSNVVDADITAPADSAYLVCNARTEYADRHFVTSGTNRIDTTDSKVSNISENTRNLIDDEKIISGDGYVVALSDSLVQPLPAGTYTITVKGTSNLSGNDSLYLRVYKAEAAQSANLLHAATFSKGTESYITFTATDEIKSIYVLAASSISASAGYTVTLDYLQIIAGNLKTPYIKYVSAVDGVAREKIESVGNDIEAYTTFESGAIVTSGSTVDISTTDGDTSYKHIVIPCAEGDTFIFEALGGGSSRVLFCFCSSDGTIMQKGTAFSESQTFTYPAQDYLVPFTAPTGTDYVVVNHHHREAQAYYPKVYKLSDDARRNYIATRVTGELPYRAENDWEYKVVATYENMIAINDSGRLKLSRDLGKTWNSGVNVSSIGTIINYHLYANGCLAFFTENKAYYTENYSQYYEASVYEADGTAYTPQATNNYDSLCDHAERKFIDTQDMYVFSNYNLDQELRKIIWYSIDNGHSYKIAYEFSANQEYDIRHVHDVIYYNTEDTFIVCTGDSNANQCNVFSLSYNVSGNSWTITRIAGSSRDYKWSNIAIYAEKIYFTYDNTPGKLMRCSYADIADVSKHETLLDFTENDALCVAISKTGEIILVQSTVRSTGGADVPIGMTRFQACRKIYYSPNGSNFVSAILPVNYINGMAIQYKIKPLTSNGRCFIGVAENSELPSISVDDFLHTIGYRQAFCTF